MLDLLVVFVQILYQFLSWFWAIHQFCLYFHIFVSVAYMSKSFWCSLNHEVPFWLIYFITKASVNSLSSLWWWLLTFLPCLSLCSFTSHFPATRSQVRPLKNQMVTSTPGSLCLLSLALSLNPLPLTPMHLKASLSPASLPLSGPYHSPICIRTEHLLTSPNQLLLMF